MLRVSSLLLALLLAAPSFAQDLPEPWQFATIGDPGQASVEVDPTALLRLTIEAETVLPTPTDDLALFYQTIESATATIDVGGFEPECTTPGFCTSSRGIGVTLRASLDPGAPYVSYMKRDGQRDQLLYRAEQNGDVEVRTQRFQYSGAFRIARVGSTIRIVAGRELIETLDIDLGAETVAGVFAVASRGRALAVSASDQNPYDATGFPDGWVRYASPTASGLLVGDGNTPLAVDLAASPESPASFVGAFSDLSDAPARSIQGRLSDVTGNAGGDGSEAFGFGLGVGRSDQGPFQRPGGGYTAIVRRADGALALRTRGPNGARPDDRPLLDEGEDLWRVTLVEIFRESARIRVDQWTGSRWSPRTYAPFYGSQAVVFADGASGQLTELRTKRETDVLPTGWQQAAIGEPSAPSGIQSATELDGSWDIVGGGDIWGRNDGFYGAFRYGQTGRDVTLSAVIAEVEPVDPWSKGGLMIRPDVTFSAPDSSAYVFAFRRPNGEYYVQSRAVAGGSTSSQPLDLPSTSSTAIAVQYSAATNRVRVLDGVRVLWTRTIDLGVVPSPVLASTSTDFTGSGTTARTTFDDVSVEFTDPGSFACGDVPAAIGTDRGIGYAPTSPLGGLSCWDAAGETLQVRGGGDIWGDEDRFRFVSQLADGAFDLSADVTTEATPPNSWTKSGLMVRGSQAVSAPFVFVLARPNGGGVYVQMRPATGDDVQSFQLSGDAAQRLRLWSDGTTVRAQATRADGTLTDPFATSFASDATTELGFAVTATTGVRSAVLAEGSFSAIDLSNGGETATAWTRDYVLATPAPLQTGSTTPLGGADGFERFDVVSAGDIWGADDQFEFVHATLAGDGVLTAEVESFEGIAPWAEPWAKAGPMVRQIVDGSLVDPRAPHKSLFTTLDRGVHFMSRVAQGGPTDIFDSPADGETPDGPLGLRIERVGDRLFYSVRFPGTTEFSPEGESVFASAAGPAAVGFALTSTQTNFQSPGQVRATVGLRLTQAAGSTAQAWTETFDGMPRAASDDGVTAWWGGEFAALTDDGALAIGGTPETATWRAEPLAAAAGLDARVTIDTDGAAAGDVLRVLALVGDAEVEIATVAGQTGTQTIQAESLRGSAVELRMVADAPGGAFLVTEAALSPALPPVADEPDAEAPVAALALSAPAPNPTRGDAWIELTARDAGTHRVEVVDLLGRRVASAETDARSGERVRIALPTAGLGAGVYLVRATAPDGATATQRMTVVR